MYVNLQKFVNPKSIKLLDRYMSELDLIELSDKTFGYTLNDGIKKDLGKGINLSEINYDAVNYIKNSYRGKINRQTITLDGYAAPTKFPFIWEKNENWHNLKTLSSFIKSLPFFEYTTRIVIIHTPPGTAGTEHTDHSEKDRVDEFIWIRTNNKKKFYIRDRNGNKNYIDCHIAWFDSRFRHNTTAIDEPCFSIRIDGKFKPYFRKYLAKRGTFRYKPYKRLMLEQYHS